MDRLRLFSRRRGPPLAGLALGGLAALSGCDIPGPELAPRESNPPPERPERSAEVSDGQSAALRAYYTRIENDRLERGLLRTDTAADDAPFTEAMLVENFIRVALYNEYRIDGAVIREGETPSRLRRWAAPVRMRLEFGPGVAESTRRADRAYLDDYARRLARATRHEITLTDDEQAANFQILVLGEDERAAIGARMRELVPGIDARTLQTVETMPRRTFCLALAFSRGGRSTYSDAVAVVRAEHPDLTRQSCYDEELAQGLGLPNDSALARPSIFNDAQEFARLTAHDELLLRILYDPRLEPGMTEAEARPIVRRIAAELMNARS
ncbi:hypothetical protein C2I36_14250 [Rhodobacteraceae bacterium WD3A24]|nr:hypothetical protein C2I36_14250 [Rhodobacteraceae bacterium WD3A24]